MDDPLYDLFEDLSDDPRYALSDHLYGSASPTPTLTAQEDLISRVAASPGSAILSLKGGLPNEDLFPDPRKVFEAAIADVDLGLLGRDMFQYAFPEGLERSCGWVADEMKQRGVNINPKQVLIVNGAHEGVSLLFRMYPPGTRVAFVGDKTYPMAIKLARAAGHVLVRQGEKADLYYCIPAAANPDGLDHVEPWRDELLASGADIIVDETFAYLRFDGVIRRPLWAGAKGRVFLVGSVSKWIAPGLRFGWVITPEDRRSALAALKASANLQTGTVAQALFVSWARRGNCGEVLIRAREFYRTHAERLVALLREKDDLSDWHITVPEGGLTLWVETDLYGSEIAFLRQAIIHQVAVDAGSRFFPFPPQTDQIMLRFGISSLSFDQMEQAVNRVANAAKSFRRHRT